MRTKRLKRNHHYRPWQIFFIGASSLAIIGLLSVITVYGSFDFRSQAAGSRPFCQPLCAKVCENGHDGTCLSRCTSFCNRFDPNPTKNSVHSTPYHPSTTPNTSHGAAKTETAPQPQTRSIGSSSTNSITVPASGAYAGAPLCPNHNDTQWHALWDAGRKCHFDHTHHDDPSLGNPVFGPAGPWGQPISYPWMTPNENNTVGHTGYKYYVNLAPQPACANEGFEYLGNVNCVSAFRIQYHDVGGSAHMVKRFHSYYMEAQVKSKNSQTTGIIRTGGWADFGCLHGSYKDFFITLPGIDPTNSQGDSRCQTGGSGRQSIHSDPYRSASTIGESKANQDNMWSWTSHNQYGYNKLGSFFFRVLDSIGGMDRANPYAEHPLCPDFMCKNNNSEHHMYTVIVHIPSSLDTDRDGIVNYKGYTDQKGTIVQGCTSPGVNCVPLEIINAPVGQALWARNLSGIRPAGDPIRDHDVYVNGRPSGWIRFPTQ